MNFRKTLIVAAGLISGMFSAAALAECVCYCVNGAPQALCSNQQLVRPACSNICGFSTVSLVSRTPTANYPIEQALNSKTGGREWRQIRKPGQVGS